MAAKKKGMHFTEENRQRIEEGIKNGESKVSIAKDIGSDPTTVAKEIKRLEKLMLECARNLEFEKAAAARDDLFRLKERIFGVVQHDTDGDGTK